MNEDNRYFVEVTENGKRLALTPIPDPFIRTVIRPRGVRAAWQVLRGRWEVWVRVDADPETVRGVEALGRETTEAENQQEGGTG